MPSKKIEAAPKKKSEKKVFLIKNSTFGRCHSELAGRLSTADRLRMDCVT